MRRYDSTCDVCGGHAFHPFARRSDGIAVVVCDRCDHGVVERFTEEVGAIYGDQYFASQGEASIGYQEYAYTAQNGLAWAAELVHLLRPHGSVVDIGCADGRLLTMLGARYESFGIELNEKMAGEARRAGVSMVARDLLDEVSLIPYTNRFDIALAIAVFEHIPKFRQAFEAAIHLLRPDGLLLFEVPLIRAEDDIWFRSSLEHLHYPTERSLQYLFERVLGLPLAGSVVEVENYGCVYVGLTSGSPDKARAEGARFEYLRTAPPAALSRDEARFRWFFDLIHAAKANPEILAMPLPLGPEEVNPLILRRILDVWAARELRWEQLEGYLSKIEEARDWHAAESQKRDNAIADLQRQLAAIDHRLAEQNAYLREVEEARDWHAAESQKRDNAIAELQHQLAAIDHRQAEQNAYLREVEEARDWHAAESQKRDNAIAELQGQNAYLRGVEEARDWHAAESQKRAGVIEGQQEQLANEERRCQALEAALAMKERQIRKLEMSFSWRITAPLRRIATIFRGSARLQLPVPTQKP